MTPREFLVVYECDECGEEYEMRNCLVPYFNMPCDVCETQTKFVKQKMIHLSWEWDRHED